jgi:hypothetical protein
LNDREIAEKEIAAVNQALIDGHPPVGNGPVASALRAASEKLRLDRCAFARRVGTPGKPGKHGVKYGISPDWSLYKEPVTFEIAIENDRVKAKDRDVLAENKRLRGRYCRSRTQPLYAGKHWNLDRFSEAAYKSTQPARPCRDHAGWFTPQNHRGSSAPHQRVVRSS